uniref:Uncharacterized protein n=1 Tax=Oryza nivara TaxID=4536 RepID=A0A0E0GM35_ORYNI
MGKLYPSIDGAHLAVTHFTVHDHHRVVLQSDPIAPTHRSTPIGTRNLYKTFLHRKLFAKVITS